jgi:hypothetical protein
MEMAAAAGKSSSGPINWHCKMTWFVFWFELELLQQWCVPGADASAAVGCSLSQDVFLNFPEPSRYSQIDILIF